jgi:hypothetical protein
LEAIRVMRKDVQKLINASEVMGWTIRGSNSSRSKRFVSSSELPNCLGATQLPIQWISGFFSGGKAAGP